MWIDLDFTISDNWNKYQISNFWKIRSYKRAWWKYLKQPIWTDWYTYFKTVLNWKPKWYKISRLIAWGFLWLDIFNSDIWVCHVDDDKTNSNSKNLFLWDGELNRIDMYVKDRQTSWFDHPFSKYPKEKILEVYKIHKEWNNYNQTAIKTNLSREYVRRLCTGYSHKAFFKNNF